MRDSPRACSIRWRAGWILPLALLTLPNCAQIVGVDEWTVQTPSGPLPRTSVVFCDIQQKLEPDDNGCAKPEDVGMGVRLEAAATDLVSGQNSPLGLDYSDSALQACAGLPRKVLFQAPFPNGYPGCVNCSEIGSQYADATAFCVSKCVDLTKGDSGFCSQPGVVKVSTNFVPDGGACYADACLEEGTLKADFADPRQHPELVVWEDLVNVSASGSTLSRDTPDTFMFDAGADAPSQIITHGDAYVEFTAVGPQVARLCGFTEGDVGDDNPTPASLSFALNLFTDGCVYAFESGNKAPGPVGTCPSPNAIEEGYFDGEVLRVRVTDNLDGTGQYAPLGGTATVTYTRLTAACLDGHECDEKLLYTSAAVAHYPLRVDSSFREQGGTLGNVRLVRIRPQ
jgi:hypothetical protein